MKNFIKKTWKVLALLLVCILIGGTVFPYLVMEEEAEAKKKNYIDLSPGTATGVNDKDVGGINNPYTILEIVPFHGMAQMLWLSGETMPDITKVRPADLDLQGYVGTMAVEGEISYDQAPMQYDLKVFNKSMNNITEQDFLEILEFLGYTGSTYIATDGKITTAGKEKAIKIIEKYGKVKFDENSYTGVYMRLQRLINNEIFKRYIIGIEDKTIRSIYNDVVGHPYSYTSSMTAEERNTVRKNYNTIKNKSETKKKVLEACENFHVRVIVATPDEVNTSVSKPNEAVSTVAVFPEKKKDGVYQTYTPQNNKSLIQMAHMVFAVGRITNENTVTLYNKVTMDKDRQTDEEKRPSNYDYLTKEGNHYKYDLSGKAAKQLLTRMVTEKLPLIVNKALMEGSGFDQHNCTHNFARVMLLSLIYDFETFKDKGYLESVTYDESAAYPSEASYKLYFQFKDGKKDSWGDELFYHYDSDKGRHVCDYDTQYTGIDKNRGYMLTACISNDSTFIFNSDENFNQTIMSKEYFNTEAQFDTATNYFKDNEICDERLIPANILRAIAGFDASGGSFPYKELTVLEIQPGGESNADNETTAAKRKEALENFYRKVIPTYTGKMNIEQVSVLEFIGMTDDLISKYNFIYFGALTGSFNMKNGKTDYNDNNMDGLIYTHTGDVVHVNVGGHYKKLRGALSMIVSGGGLRKKGTVSMNADTNAGGVYDVDGGDVYRLSGNDLTLRMEKKLEDYVKSNQPVIFDHSYFSESSASGVNEDLIDNSSYMFDFVKFCCSKDEDGNYIYKDKWVFDFKEVADAHSSAFQMAIQNADKVIVEIEEDWVPVDYAKISKDEPDRIVASGVLSTSRRLTFKFRIRTSDTSKRYQTRCRYLCRRQFQHNRFNAYRRIWHED